MREMNHNNVDIYKGIEYLSNPHYQLLEYIFVRCINKQNNAVIIPVTVLSAFMEIVQIR